MASKEKKGFPEGMEIPLGVGTRWLVKRGVISALNSAERLHSEAFRDVAWVMTHESAADVKRWSEGTFLIGATLFENISDHLQVWEWVREVIERAGPDIPATVDEYFKLRVANRTIVFPEGYIGPSGDAAKKALVEFGSKVQQAFISRAKRAFPILAKLKEAWDKLMGRSSGREEFQHHSFKKLRATFPTLEPSKREALVSFFWGKESSEFLTTVDFAQSNVTPITPEVQEKWENDQKLWNYKESAEYADTKEKQSALADMARDYPRHFRFWLALQDHDSWFNFMSPKMKEHGKKLLNALDSGVGKLADDLSAWAKRRKDARELKSRGKQERSSKKAPPKLPSRMLNFVRERPATWALACLVLDTAAYLTLLHKYPQYATWLAIVTVVGALALGIIALFSQHAAQESIRRQKEISNG